MQYHSNKNNAFSVTNYRRKCSTKACSINEHQHKSAAHHSACTLWSTSSTARRSHM